MIHIRSSSQWLSMIPDRQNPSSRSTEHGLGHPGPMFGGCPEWWWASPVAAAPGTWWDLKTPHGTAMSSMFLISSRAVSCQSILLFIEFILVCRVCWCSLLYGSLLPESHETYQVVVIAEEKMASLSPVRMVILMGYGMPPMLANMTLACS